MKKITIIYLLGLIVLFSSCEVNKKVDRGKISFPKDKIIMEHRIDTVEIKADKGFYIHHVINSCDMNSKDVFYPNSTRDTIVTPWIKAISLKDDDNTLKIITLNRNITCINRCCFINVSNGSYFGWVDVTQLAE